MPSTHDAAAPLPPDISPAVEPLLEVLAAFPLPQLLAPSAPAERLDFAAARGMSHASDDALKETVMGFARTLLASSSYMALRRGAEEEGDGGGGTQQNTPRLSPLARRIHEGLLRIEIDRLHSIGGVRGAGAPSQQVRWAHNAECHMTLRRRSAPEGGGEKENAEEAAARAPKQEPKSSPASPVRLRGAVHANARPVTPPPASCGPSTLADIIGAGVQGSRALASLLGALLDAPQPFKDVPAERLTAFVSSLLTLPEAAATSPAEFVLPAAAMERAVACCACISHPAFEPSLLAEDAVDRLITVLAALLRRVRRRHLGHAPDDAGAAAELECLRAMLRCFALVVADPRLRLCAHGDLLRLEDLCFQCLFALPGACGRQEAANYATHVVSHALHLYSALWNRLEAQRDAAWERFFPRLPHGEHLLLRPHLLPSGVKAAALTAAVVAAAQSTPVGAGPVTRGAADHLQQQCCVWSNMFFRHFLLEERDDKREREMCGAIVLQFCEDLANMLGLPEFPAADMLLRALLVSFAKHCFSSAATEGTRALFLDVVFRVSCVLFSPAQQALLQSAALPEACALTDAQLQQWRQLTHPGEAAVEAEAPLPHDELRRALLYVALSHRVADPAPDVAAAAWHLRAAHVYAWAIHDATRFPDAVLAALVQATQVADGGVAVDWGVLHACSAQLCGACDKSLLSAMAKERLPSWLLSVFQLREERQQQLAGLEAARKRAIQHMGKLAALHPPLLARVWPIARRCVRDDNARVREAIVPLFLTLLSEACGGAHAEETAAEVVSSLLHLLTDRSAAVVARAIAALDTLLTDASLRPLLEASAAGENLLTFTESKLLALLGPAREARHQSCVVRLFLRRWVGQEAAADVTGRPTRARVARELMRLTVTNVAYPYEAPAAQPLVVLLRGMCRLTEGRETPRRGARNVAVDALELRDAMLGAAKVLWAEHQRLTPAPEAAAALAAVHALALACSAWVEPLLEVLAQTLVQSISPSSPTSAAAKEAVGVTLLHVCRILRTVLLAPRPPPLALDPLARALTTVLARYVGPHQQQILLSASGVLSAAITCGGDGLADYANAKYLGLCYSLMNAYYVRALSLAPTLRTDPQSVAYTLRFLFLLSEFLRLCPAWGQHHPELAEAAAVGGSGVPNQLALGDGICANVYAAVERVLRECPAEAQKRTTVIALRVFASLCMLQPTVFLRRCEPHLRRALDPAGDLALQSQALVLIRDFLKDEDARIDHAASTAAPVPLPSDSSVSSSPTARRRRRREELQVEVAPCVAEQNSGMATWVMQQFHPQILQLCEVKAVAVRQLAFEVLQLCAEGGLLPPSRYASALIVLAADPQSEALRQAAVECMAAQSERYADVVAANAAVGVVRAFDLHDACDVDVLQSAVLADTSLQAGECIHARLFASLRKRYRDAFLSSLLRYLYQEARAAQWLREHRASDGASARSPFPFLCHLTVVTAFVPYTHESDVLHVLDNCRAAVDLVGQSCLDFAEAQLSLLRSRKRPTHPQRRKGGTGGDDNVDDHAARQDRAVELWMCFGVLCISQLRTFLRGEYGLHGARLRRLAMRRRSGGAQQLITLARREPQSAASVTFRQGLAALLRRAAPLWESPPTDASSRRRALEELCGALAGLLQEAEAEAAADDRESPRGSRGSAQLRARGSRGTLPAAEEADEAQPGRRRQRRPQKRRRMTAEEAEEDEEDATATTRSSSGSSSGSSDSSSASGDDDGAGSAGSE
ncbi:uncharacterized protein Tco025E_03819 [Trypanosoma conorhini]|uniref:Sister chromatid cohesion protein n=1 Tax=Trypanosoma conorhini TaxID=83891 RepID=A0A3R7L5V1_9TRYP|nr:uncharacterized protein Tco025E_03819 [Trypanosoma conorhini]RNF20332.1 hypothetical protein Tco025E_03819 [Trypanosoma conorhini]